MTDLDLLREALTNISSQFNSPISSFALMLEREIVRLEKIRQEEREKHLHEIENHKRVVMVPLTPEEPKEKQNFTMKSSNVLHGTEEFSYTATKSRIQSKPKGT